MTIHQKVLATSGSSLFLLLVTGVVSYMGIDKLMELTSLRVAMTNRLLAVRYLREGLTDAETGQRGYILTGDPAYLQPYLTGVQASQRYLEEFRRLFTEPADQPKLDTLDRVVVAKLAELKETVDLRRDKSFDAAMQMVKSNSGKNYMDQARAILAELDQQNTKLRQEQRQKATEIASATRTTVTAITLASFILILGIGGLLLRAITIPLASFLVLVEKVGVGDLTVEAPLMGRDEFGLLGNSLNRMISGLRNLATQTRLATENLTSATGEILALTQEQAASTAEQAAAVQQTTVTMDEIRQSGVQIADRAKEVAAAAQETAASSDAGIQAVQNTGRAMVSIREQGEAVAENIVRLSERTQVIGEIVATVNDIAEQSHLLALNAAIEAAAAGEHGRSFAVVASEIKNLADQSKEATIQVRSILSEIQRGINSSVMLTEENVKRVEAGKQYAETADATIRHMAENIQQSGQLFQQIAGGANQQHIGFEQVLQSIRNIGQASQQSASATRQLEKAAADLSAPGQQLKTVGDVYRI